MFVIVFVKDLVYSINKYLWASNMWYELSQVTQWFVRICLPKWRHGDWVFHLVGKIPGRTWPLIFLPWESMDSEAWSGLPTKSMGSQERTQFSDWACMHALWSGPNSQSPGATQWASQTDIPTLVGCQSMGQPAYNGRWRLFMWPVFLRVSWHHSGSPVLLSRVLKANQSSSSWKNMNEITLPPTGIQGTRRIHWARDISEQWVSPLIFNKLSREPHIPP